VIVKLVKCPACGSKKFIKVIALDNDRLTRYLKFSKIKYDCLIDGWIDKLDVAIYGCSDCGHHSYREQPSKEMLSVMYERGLPLNPQQGIDRRLPTLQMIREMKRIRKLVETTAPSFLDFGSGFGRWARAAYNVGFDVTAYEPSQERGSEDVDTEFTLVHNEDDLKNQLFDVINLEQVLEHVPDPLTLLNDIRAYCKPETVLRISVPNLLRCPEASAIWKSWPYDDSRVHTMAPFEHLHGFTPNSLRILAFRAKFKLITDVRVWIRYPKEMLRFYIAKFLPKFGQTFLLLRLSEQ
jgi:SAM-dependent methyltransferase